MEPSEVLRPFPELRAGVTFMANLHAQACQVLMRTFPGRECRESRSVLACGSTLRSPQYLLGFH